MSNERITRRNFTHIYEFSRSGLLFITSWNVLLLALLLLVVGCARREAANTNRDDVPNRAAVNVAYNRDLVAAEVLAVRRQMHPRVQFDLRILAIKQSKGAVSFAKVGEVITASPNFKFGPGSELDLSVPENRALIALDGVREKDTISVEVMFTGGEQAQAWRIEDFRLPEDR